MNDEFDYSEIHPSLQSIVDLTYSSLSFVKMTAEDTFALDTNVYYTQTEVDNLLAALTYASITGNDVLTDILATELEQLSDGSDTALHIHDSRYYTETEIDAGYLKLDCSNDPLTSDLDIVYTATEMEVHALELDVDAAGYGDVKALDIDYITGAITDGQDEGVILINIDETDATGGEIFGIEVLATDGSANISGLKAGALIDPVHQDSGVFANPTTGTDNTASTDVPAMIDGSTGTTTAIFENDNEYIIVGAAAAFEEVEFILTTTASVSIKPTYWYSTAGAGQFTQFTPVDGTNGFRNTGVVAWDASDLTGHTINDDTGTYDIKVIRTRNSLVTSPILGYMKTAATTEYIWDKNGDVNVKSLTANNLTLDGTFTDGTMSITGGNITSMGNITGTDVDISAGTGNITTTGTVDASSLTVDGGMTFEMNSTSGEIYPPANFYDDASFAGVILGTTNDFSADIIAGDIYADNYYFNSPVLDKQGLTALSQFTTTSEERTKDGKYDHDNVDEDLIKVLVPFKKGRPAKLNRQGAIIREATPDIPEHYSSSLILLVQLQRDAILELKTRLEVLEEQVSN